MKDRELFRKMVEYVQEVENINIGVGAILDRDSTATIRSGYFIAYNNEWKEKRYVEFRIHLDSGKLELFGL